MTVCELKAEGQSFQSIDSLQNSLNTSLPNLQQSILEKYASETVYCYVIMTIGEAEDGSFIQYGSAPNFQGGVITLCTCKHWMRSMRTVEQWEEGAWVAGFSGLTYAGEQALVYLMRVGEAFESYQHLWEASRYLTPAIKNLKLSQNSRYGDLYKPTGEGLPFEPDSYIAPPSDHIHANNNFWYNDVDIHYKRPSALLVGDRDKSFLWNKPQIHWNQKEIGRGYRKQTVKELFSNLI